MNWQLELSDESILDIQDISYFYGSLPVGRLEERFISDLKESIFYIAENPLTLAVKYRNVRIRNLKVFPYQIHYFTNGNMVRVIGVFHAKSNPTSWINRIKS